MTEDALPDDMPEAGAIRVMRTDDAAELVEEVAEDALTHPESVDTLLIALDIDGTILLEDGSFSPGIVDAVRDARDAGHEVMLATGRSWDSTRGILHALVLAPEYVVCSNGAVTLRRVDADESRYEPVHIESFDATEVLRRLRSRLADAHYMVELPDGSRLYTEQFDDWQLLHARRVPFDQLAHNPVVRVVVVSPTHSEQEFQALVQEIGLHQVSYAIGWTAWLDIAPYGVDKGTALERVRAWLGIDPSRVLVMGDGRNDVGMFAWAVERGGRAVAMAQGPDEVRAAASEVTGSVQDGGVTRVLRAL